MSSLARRSLRATAAAAGIAAAGVGLAGPAFAAPAAPERPSTDDAAPSTGSTPNVLGSAPKTSQVPDLPQLFTIQGTSVHTADRGLSQLPTARHLPTQALPRTDDAINMGETQRTRGTDVEFRTAAPQQRDSAMQQLDAASMFDAVPGEVLGSTANNDVQY
jgi:hypothetical protein